MRVIRLMILIVLLSFSGCAVEPENQSAISDNEEMGTAEYLATIKPILDKRCVVCHSCYNSPCQLKLSSYDGLDRGASKKAVYDSKRLWTMEPTRLFVDAQNTAEWREKGFTSVREETTEGDSDSSMLMKMLAHKNAHQSSLCSEAIDDSCNSFRPEDDELTCAATAIEMDDYLKKHPNRGMPYGFPPLTAEEFKHISSWLKSGGLGPTPEQHEERAAIAPGDKADVEKWERFFNTTDAKHKMTARYLYEHLFLAHISFSQSRDTFYELVRSRTPPGKDIVIIPTVRPYDNPGEGPFYYRFRKIYSTIVHKTHMVFELSDEQLARYNELFIQPTWQEMPQWVGFERLNNANPFEVFEQIPLKSRYQFLLDNSHYIIMTFIRGPVCKGQVALNVVRDHFWLLFMDPDYDLTVQHPAFLHDNLKLTTIPTEQGSFFSLFKFWMVPKYEVYASHYVKKRQDYYAKTYGYRGLDYQAIWAGEKASNAPMLTVFRHFNSASVHKGALGDLPRTLWVMDYPLMERIYYALVAGFDVYGSVGHQLAVRLYMDNLRQEGETYFLDFLPQKNRKPLMKSWYGGMSLEKIHYQPSSMPSGIQYTTEDPQREFVENLVDNHFNPDIKIAFDENYRRDGEGYPETPKHYVTEDDYIQGFHSVSAPGTPFFSFMKDHDANLAYVRIRISETENQVVSMVVNRWHDDVRTLSREEDKLQPKKDEADFIRGYVGSYPNYFFDVDLDDLPDFINMLKTYDGSPMANAKVLKYGINRADMDFWQHYDWFQHDFSSSDPLYSGLFDLNRYYHLAVKSDVGK